MAIPDFHTLSSRSPIRSASSTGQSTLQTELDRFNFLSFLATAQALKIEFLPIVWDIGRDITGGGAASNVWQGLVNARTSFAFKTFLTEYETEEKIFRDLINEITILSQPFMRQHENIVQLLGISWEMDDGKAKPWPALVFEKSRLGDLHSFIGLEGGDMTVDERLGICADVAKAIISMHTNGIIHSDIKPKNVLIFSGESTKYHARVIDFGCSARYPDDDENHTRAFRGTEEWSAPEYLSHDPKWTRVDAERADIYALGMLYFWILFQPYLSGQKSPPTGCPDPECTSSGPAESIPQNIKDEFQNCTKQLLKAEPDLSSDQKRRLLAIFDSSLSQFPEERKLEPFKNFLRLQDPSGTNIKTETLDGLENGLKATDFQIQKSIFDLYRADYRVRTHIFQCLQKIDQNHEQIIFQKALCYYIGFGIKRDEAKTQETLKDTRYTIENVQETVTAISETPDTFQAAETSRLKKFGYVLWSDYANVYLQQSEKSTLKEAEEQLAREVNDLKSICGEDHLLTSMLQFSLAHIYTVQNRWREAEKLELQVEKTTKKLLGHSHTSTVTGMIHLATTYKRQGKLRQAIELELKAKEICEEQFGLTHPDTFTSMNNLAVSYWEDQKLEDAKDILEMIREKSKLELGPDHDFTLKVMSNLAAIYRGLKMLDSAAKVGVEVIEICERTLDKDHLMTLTAKSGHARTLIYQSRREEALALYKEVLEARKRKLPSDHPDVEISRINVADTLLISGRIAEWAALKCDGLLQKLKNGVAWLIGLLRLVFVRRSG